MLVRATKLTLCVIVSVALCGCDSGGSTEVPPADPAKEAAAIGAGAPQTKPLARKINKPPASQNVRSTGVKPFTD
jgi:hypothetical protein